MFLRINLINSGLKLAESMCFIRIRLHFAHGNVTFSQLTPLFVNHVFMLLKGCDCTVPGQFSADISRIINKFIFIQTQILLHTFLGESLGMGLHL